MIHKTLIYLALTLSLVVNGQHSIKVPSKMDFAGMKLNITEKGRRAIQEEVDRITQSPKYFNAKVQKANVHFPIIERAFIEEGISTDFKYLALQESALIPDIVSSSNAVGYWQFKDFTAIQMGLRVDKYVDERMNIYASSRAAARYMKKNNEYFDNWLFALQAYQMGAGAALKVLDDKHFGSNSLTITDETYWYVRTFLAHKIAYEDAVGKERPNPELMIYTQVKGKSLQDVAREANLDEELVVSYNKWIRKGKIPADKEYWVILPKTELLKVEQIADAEKKNEPMTRKVNEFDVLQSNKFPEIDPKKEYSTNSQWKKINGIPGVIAKSGQKMRDVAIIGDLDIGELLKINDLKIDHHVKEGDILYFKKKHRKAGLYYHVVQEEEELWDIAQKYGMRLNHLLTKNRMKDIEYVKPGRVLWLRHIRPANVPIEYRTIKKELIVSIPMGSNKNLKDSKEKKLSNTDSLLVETFQDELAIDLDSVDSELENINKELKYDSSNSTNEEELIVIVKHEVRAGETLYRISKIYKVEVMEVVEWNGLNLNEAIKPGQFLILYTKETLKESNSVKRTDSYEETDIIQKYTVRKGDTLYKIAKEYDLNIDELMKWNNKLDYNVAEGEILLIKVLKNDE